MALTGNPARINQFFGQQQRCCFLRASATAALKSLPEESIDSFVSDPPYGIELKLGTNRNRNSIAGDGRVAARRLWEVTMPEMFRAAKPDSAHLFFGTWKSPWMFDVLSASFQVKGCIAWNKRLFGLGHYLRPQWEMIYFCVKGKPPRRGPAPGDVWEQLRVIKTRHPCEKPVELLRRAVRLVAPPGSIVGDPFAGIASGGVAALAEGCRFFGCEIDRRHWQLGRRRLAEAAENARDSRAMRDLPNPPRTGFEAS